MKIYHTTEKGWFCGSEKALESPLEPGKYIISPDAILIEPSFIEGNWPKWDGSAWQQKPLGRRERSEIAVPWLRWWKSDAQTRVHEDYLDALVRADQEDLKAASAAYQALIDQTLLLIR